VLIPDVSGQPIGPIFKGQESQKLEVGADMFSRNGGKELPPLAAQ